MVEIVEDDVISIDTLLQYLMTLRKYPKDPYLPTLIDNKGSTLYQLIRIFSPCQNNLNAAKLVSTFILRKANC